MTYYERLSCLFFCSQATKEALTSKGNKKKVKQQQQQKKLTTLFFTVLQKQLQLQLQLQWQFLTFDIYSDIFKNGRSFLSFFCCLSPLPFLKRSF